MTTAYDYSMIAASNRLRKTWRRGVAATRSPQTLAIATKFGGIKPPHGFQQPAKRTNAVALPGKWEEPMKSIYIFVVAAFLCAGTCFGAEQSWIGKISDTMCGAHHQMAAAQKLSDADCTK